MRLGGVGLLVAVLALAGCKGGAPKPIEKKDPASPVSRTKGAGPAWLEDSMARLPGAGTGVPTVRLECESRGGFLIRINPRESDVPRRAVALPLGSLEALRRMNALV